MSSPIFDATFGTGRFKREEPMTTDQSQATPAPPPKDGRMITDADLDYLRNINTSPGPNAGRSINPTKPGPDADRASPEPRDVREALNEALRFLDKIDHWVSAKYATLAARKICDALEKLPALAQSNAEPTQDMQERAKRIYEDLQEGQFLRERSVDIIATALAQSDAGPPPLRYSDKVERADDGTETRRLELAIGEPMPDCPTDGVAARQGNGG
jgi:hypothetical protein